MDFCMSQARAWISACLKPGDGFLHVSSQGMDFCMSQARAWISACLRPGHGFLHVSGQGMDFYMSQARRWISSILCHCLFLFNDLRDEVIVRSVDIGGIVDFPLKEINLLQKMLTITV
jgi:hypothetical protein